MKSTIVVCGLRAVEEAINAAGTVSRIYCNQNQHSARRRALCEQATALGIDVVYVGKERLDRLAEGIRHQGMVAVGIAMLASAFYPNPSGVCAPAT